ncbi:MAG TPA: hypothetical protein DDW91_02955 [Shewanella frigidimarina]|nr:hypothetical protein [Shewanella frigidimarina]
MEIPTFGKITPHPFQWELIQNTLSHIRKQFNGEVEIAPSFIHAYVSAGKTIIAGAIANHCHRTKHKLLILARTGELVDQDAEEVFNMGSPCSIYSASLGQKSTYYSTVVGTEGTVANALNKEFSSDIDERTGKHIGFIPSIILIDENHEVSWQSVLDETENQYAKIINHFKAANPKLVIIGMTGSPYRGVESIRGPFWKEEIQPVIDRRFLVDNEYIVPTIFGYGHDNVGYDLSEFNSINEVGTTDFGNADMERMHSKMNRETTKLIMDEVQSVMQSRLCALITCAGLKHCEEAAACVPDDECAIVTEATKKADRQQIIKDAKKGLLNERGTFRYKYVFQCNCLTTGVNVPLWCTSVLLRRIGSLTLLTQLLGRGMRLLKDDHIAAGYTKDDHLCLDYSGTMDAMHELFNDPLLEDATLSHSKQDGSFITCPICDTQNGVYSRRCIGTDTIGDQPDHRCGHWWKFRQCEDLRLNNILIEQGCGHKNDIAAKICSNCNKYLIDPNANLSHKAYTDADWKPVLKMDMEIIGARSDATQVTYWLDSFGIDGQQEIAKVKYWAIMAGGKRVWDSKFVKAHAKPALWKKLLQMTPALLMENKDLFITPKMATHRINAKGESIVNVSNKKVAE